MSDFKETIKIKVSFSYQGEKTRIWNIKVRNDTDVFTLMYKLRKFLKLKDCEAIFLFFVYDGLFYKKDKLYPTNKLLKDIQNELCMEMLYVKVMLENVYGNLDARFLMADIEEINTVWVLKITYSYYNLYSYTSVFILKTLDEAIKKLAVERCDERLTIKDKNGNEVKLNV